MAQDIREMLSKNKFEEGNLPEGHQNRFEKLLEEKLPLDTTSNSSQSKKLPWLKVAVVTLLLGLTAIWLFNNAFAKAELNSPEVVATPSIDAATEEEAEVSLSALSPEFKKIEDYYLASVNLELARLEITDDNKELIDAFMQQLSELDAEYKRLNKEISESGVSEEMVNAMIENLKLRVQLMVKLKTKLKEIRDAENQEAAQQIV